MRTDRPPSPSFLRAAPAARVIGVRGLVVLVCVASGCSAGPDRGERADGVESVRVVTTAVMSSAAAVTSTTAPSPVTKPLTTAPPSPLLDEVVAAYDAAYQDLLTAEATMDSDSPVLDDHMAGAQLEKVRQVLAGRRSRGERMRGGGGGWRRVEVLQSVSVGQVDLTVCRFDPQVVVDRSGQVVGEDRRTFRYVEQFDQVGGWKWVGRSWLDDGSASDCASQP